MNVFFLLNPNAGTRRDHETISQLITSIAADGGLEAELRSSPTAAGVEKLVTEAVEAGADVICAVGGDGTVHEVGRHLVGTDATLGIIPLGSGNGLARHLGIPCDVRGALRTFSAPTTARIDTGLIAGRPFLGVCGVGLDGLVARAFQSSSTRGLRTYIRRGYSAWKTRKSIEYSLEIDDGVHQVSAELIAFANSGQYGNEARVAPLASLRDGLIDIAILQDTSIARAPGLLFRLFTGQFHAAPGVTMLQGRRVKLKTEDPVVAHIDGDPVELPSKFEVSLRERSLNVLIPDSLRRI